MNDKPLPWLRPGVAWVARLPGWTRPAVLAALLVLPAAAWMMAPGPMRWSGMAAVAVLGYLAWCMQHLQARSLRELQCVVDAVCDGDLTRSPVLGGRDDVARITSGVDDMTRRLSRLVASVRSEAQLVAMASERLSGTAATMSDRTEQQASSLEETAAGVSELAATVRRNAEEMRAADEQAEAVRVGAEEAARVVESAVASMQGMEKRAGQMTEIIGVIDGIAFQTNILALNAAVEAARAGDAGRGFAVVAAEVRTLAQRSAQAAAEVKTLIEGSTREVHGGVAQIREASESLAGVVRGIREVTARLGAVTASSAQQSNGLLEISQAVNALDSLTQGNAQMVDTTVHAAQSLREQAQQLSAGVVSMRLRQGCADEARAMVERAVEFIAQTGRAAAVQRFHDRSGGFVDRDMFIIVIDRNGWFRAFGMDPSKADKPAVAAPGVNIDELNARTWRCADEGGGWLQFKSLHPITKLPADKMAYVLPAGPDWVVMCSINKNDGRD